MREGSPDFEQLAQEEAKKRAEAEKTEKTRELEGLSDEEIANAVDAAGEGSPLSDVSEEEIDEGLKGLE